MKPCSPAGQALLASGTFLTADLYDFTFVGGQVRSYTSLDVDVSIGGKRYSSGGLVGPFFDRKDNKAKCHWKIGVEVDTLVFDVVPGTATILGTPFLQSCVLGKFDGAELVLSQALMPVPANPVTPPIATATDQFIKFAGRVAEIDLGRGIATFTVNSHLELLNLNLPRNLFQAGCVNSLYDAACGVDRALYTFNSTVFNNSPTASSIPFASPSFADGYYDQGSIAFTTGQNAGLARSIKQAAWNPGGYGVVATIKPFPFAPAVGDSCVLLPGCDKTLGPNGCPKFNNVPRFKGFPFIPIPETAV